MYERYRNPQLNIFDRPKFENELFGGEYFDVMPYNLITEGGNIDFFLKDNKEYIDLSETTLTVKLKITDPEGKTIPVAQDGKDNIVLVNNAMHSIFEDVKVFLNQKQVEGSHGSYPYKAYLSTVFSYSEKVQKEQLFAIGWQRDDYNKMDEHANSAFIARKKWTVGGASKTFYGKLNLGFFQSGHLLPPSVDMNIRFQQAKEAFALLSSVQGGMKAKIEIQEMKLSFLAVKVHPEVMYTHMRRLANNEPAVFGFNRIEIETIPLAKDLQGTRKESLFYGRVPKYVIMAMTSTAAYYGDYNKNPFHFKPYAVKYLHLTRDSEPAPFEKFEPDFKTGDCLREYMALYQSNNLLGANNTLPISYDEFKNGFTHFQWNLSDDRKGGVASPDQRANLMLEMKFADPLPEAVTVILFGIMDSLVEVFGNDTVLVDGV